MFSKRFFRTKNEVEVTSWVDRPDVELIEWAADVMDWDPVPIERGRGDKGPHTLRVRFPKDTAVQFRYRFNGHWENDEAADAYWPNEHGSDNSVVLTNA